MTVIEERNFKTWYVLNDCYWGKKVKKHGMF